MIWRRQSPQREGLEFAPTDIDRINYLPSINKLQKSAFKSWDSEGVLKLSDLEPPALVSLICAVLFTAAAGHRFMGGRSSQSPYAVLLQASWVRPTTEPGALRSLCGKRASYLMQSVLVMTKMA